MTAPNKPLDHATARIVAELTAGLLPPLKETVSASLAAAAKSLPLNVDKEVEEALASLRRLNDVSADMADALASAHGSVSRLSEELLPLRQACEAAASAKIAEPAETRADEASETNNLLRSISASLSDWGAVLKANGRAQTQELSEFSAEVSEQVDWIKSAMPALFSSCADEFEKKSAESVQANVRTLEKRLTGLEKIGKMIILGLLVIVAALAFLYTKK